MRRSIILGIQTVLICLLPGLGYASLSGIIPNSVPNPGAINNYSSKLDLHEGAYCNACHSVMGATTQAKIYEVDLTTSPPSRIKNLVGKPAPTVVAPGETANFVMVISEGSALLYPYESFGPSGEFAAGGFTVSTETDPRTGAGYGKWGISLNPENMGPDGIPWVKLNSAHEPTHNGAQICSPVAYIEDYCGDGPKPVDKNGEIEFYFSWTAPLDLPVGTVKTLYGTGFSALCCDYSHPFIAADIAEMPVVIGDRRRRQTEKGHS